MRILTVGGLFLTDGLRARGHEAASLGPPGSSRHPDDRETDFFSDPGAARRTLRARAEAFRPDWILLVDDSTPLAHLGWEDLPWPKAWYAVDSHLHVAWHRHLAPAFDRVWVAQANRARALSAFRSAQAPASWLPLWFPDPPGFVPWSARARDASFVGTVDPKLNPARAALLQALAERGVAVFATTGSRQDIYRETRVVLNQSVADDLNFRFFEAMGHGALLVTDRISHSLADIGGADSDYLTYAPGDADGAAARIRWALEHPAEAEAMARRGQARVLAAHTLGHRVESVIRSLSEPVTAKLPQREIDGHLAAAFGHLALLQYPLSLTDFFAAEARRLGARAPGHPWASLALARLELADGRPGRALAALGDEGEPGDDADGEYLRSYAWLKGALLAQAGRPEEARCAVLKGLHAFPADPELFRLAAKLGLGPNPPLARA